MLKSVNSPVPGLSWMLSTANPTVEHQIVTDRSEIVYPNDIPGVGNFFIEGSRCTLPKALMMTWVTEGLTRRK